MIRKKTKAILSIDSTNYYPSIRQHWQNITYWHNGRFIYLTFYKDDKVTECLLYSPAPDYENPSGVKGKLPNAILDYENPPVQTSTSPHPSQYDSPSPLCPPPQNLSQTAAPKGGQSEDYLVPRDSPEPLSDPTEYHVLESPYQQTPSNPIEYQVLESPYQQTPNDPTEYHILESPYLSPNTGNTISEPDHLVSVAKAWLSADRTF